MEQPPEGTAERLSEYLTRHFNDLTLSVNSLKDTVRLWAKNGFTGSFIGNLTGNVTGNVTGNITGNVTGNLTGNVTGNSFKFPAIIVASSDVNTLDDYEEGIWTPTLTNITFTGTNTSLYSYTKIGRLVTISIELQAVTSVAVLGTSIISLPFTSDKDGTGVFISSVGITGGYITGANLYSAGTATAVRFRFSASYFTDT